MPYANAIGEFVQQIAALETWEERCERLGRNVETAQTDLDYLWSQDEELERLISEARSILNEKT